MTTVYAWPPVCLVAWGHTLEQPVSRSEGVFQAKARTSSTLRPRRYVTAGVAAIGKDGGGAGYVEMLNRYLKGGENLIRLNCPSPNSFHMSRKPRDFRNDLLNWTSDEAAMEWTTEGDQLLWGTGDWGLQGEPTTDDKGYPAIRVTGLPRSGVVARPAEYLTVTDGTTTEGAHVVTTAYGMLDTESSVTTGSAIIRLTEALTVSGLVSIGASESIVFEVNDLPAELQPANGSWSNTYQLREVFEDEYADGWTEEDPWR